MNNYARSINQIDFKSHLKINYLGNTFEDNKRGYKFLFIVRYKIFARYKMLKRVDFHVSPGFEV